MFERFDKDAQRVWACAGEIAAARARIEQGVGLGQGVPVRETFVGNVTITFDDLSAALALEEKGTSFSATVEPKLANALNRIPFDSLTDVKPGDPITVESLWDVLRCH